MQQQYLLRAVLRPDLLQFVADGTTDGSFTAKDVKRVAYYTFFTPVVAMLTPRRLTAQEARVQLYQNVVAPLFDDYFDHPDLSPALLLQLMYNLSTWQPRSTRERVLMRYMHRILGNVTDGDRFRHAVLTLYDAQMRSLDQQHETLTTEEIRERTYDKGGYSLLLFMSGLTDPLTDTEAEAAYLFGGLIQYADDIFDVWEDAQAGIATLATTATDIPTLRKDYESELARLIKLYKSEKIKTHFIPSKTNSVLEEGVYLQFLNNKTPRSNGNSIAQQSLLLLVRALVALEQLEATQRKHGGAFDLRRYERREVVCDMALWRNNVKMIQYFIRFFSEK